VEQTLIFASNLIVLLIAQLIDFALLLFSVQNHFSTKLDFDPELFLFQLQPFFPGTSL